MATTQGPKPSKIQHLPSSSTGPKRYRWTRDDFYRLGELGFFRDQRVELVGGEIFLVTSNPPHATAVELLGDALRAIFGAGYRVRMQQPLNLGTWSQPQPDASVIRGGPRDHNTAHPSKALLAVEVSESTLRYDRLNKMRRYARAAIGEYWIVNLVDRQLEVHRNPGPDPARPYRHLYSDVMIVPSTGIVSPQAAPGSVIAVADLLP